MRWSCCGVPAEMITRHYGQVLRTSPHYHRAYTTSDRMPGYLWDTWLAFLDQVSTYPLGCKGRVNKPTQTNLVVTGLTAVFNLYTRSAGVCYFSAGAVLCSVSVKLVKRVIRQPRPPHIPGRKAKVSYGYDSTSSRMSCRTIR